MSSYEHKKEGDSNILKCKECGMSYDILSEESVAEHKKYHFEVSVLKHRISKDMTYEKASAIETAFFQENWGEKSFEEFELALGKYLEAAFWLEILQLVEERNLIELKHFPRFDDYRINAIKDLWVELLLPKMHILKIQEKYGVRLSDDEFDQKRQKLIKSAEQVSDILDSTEQDLDMQNDAEEDLVRRKVLFTYGMSTDFQLIVTDAPKDAIENWCNQYITDQENGKNNEPFYTLKSQYYVRELLDSETEDSSEDLDVIGWEECYDYANYKSEEIRPEIYWAASMNSPSVEEIIAFLENYKGLGLKVSIMGISQFDAFVTKDCLIFDEESLAEEPTRLLDVMSNNQEKKKLVEFEVEGKSYAVYGEYNICRGTYYDSDNNQETYNYPEFSMLSAKLIEDGQEKDFIPDGVTWSGRKYDVSDMIQDFLSKQTLYNKLYKAVYVEEGLQELIDTYHDDIALVYNDVPIPMKVLSNDMYDLYELQLVTSEYIYYMGNGCCLMLNLNDHSVASDNSFACDGYMTSVENIRSCESEEELIWGELNEE